MGYIKIGDKKLNVDKGISYIIGETKLVKQGTNMPNGWKKLQDITFGDNYEVIAEAETLPGNTGHLIGTTPAGALGYANDKRDEIGANSITLKTKAEHYTPQITLELWEYIGIETGD